MKRKTKISKIKVLVFFLLSLFLVAAHSENAHSACGSAAYIYSTDFSSAQEFGNFLESDPNGCEVVDLVHIDSISGYDLSGYDLIIIGSDTGYLDNWGVTSSISEINSLGRPILGIGEGGYAFFGKLSLEIGWPHGSHWSQSDPLDYRLYIASPSATIFTSPYMITIPGDLILPVYYSSGDNNLNKSEYISASLTVFF